MVQFYTSQDSGRNRAKVQQLALPYIKSLVATRAFSLVHPVETTPISFRGIHIERNCSNQLVLGRLCSQTEFHTFLISKDQALQ